jgi:hypothetical protein
MYVTGAEAVITSDLPDIHDLPLDADLAGDGAEFERISRRCDASFPVVAAFNSSI